METKKEKAYCLENKKATFLQIGLVISLGAVLMAFEWTSTSRISDIENINTFVIDTEMVALVQPDPPKKIEAPKITTIFNLVESGPVDEIEIDVEFGKETRNDTFAIRKIEVEDPPQIIDEWVAVPEVMPEFKGGFEAMNKFFSENISYPRDAVDINMTGTVYVTFVIGKDGNVKKSWVERSVFPSLDAEALRVINLMPAWTPGRQGGRPVAVKMTMPIRFALSN